MKSSEFGGVIHTYQKYDPKDFSFLHSKSDSVSPAFDFFMHHSSRTEISDRELENLMEFDPEEFSGIFGPSLESLLEYLRAMKRQILETYDVEGSHVKAKTLYQMKAEKATVNFPEAREILESEQLMHVEEFWHYLDRYGKFPELKAKLPSLIQDLNEIYALTELGSYPFTGKQKVSPGEASPLLEKLQMIDRLIDELENAQKTSKMVRIDVASIEGYFQENPEFLEQFHKIMDIMKKFVEDVAKNQGLEKIAAGYQLTPKAYRVFQDKLLSTIFSKMMESRAGRHDVKINGEGAVETQKTKQYEFGDSVANMDVAASLTNAIIRDPSNFVMKPDDIVIHHTRNVPKSSTVVLLDMSGSMRYAGVFFDVKRMALAFDRLVRKEYPGDFLAFFELFTFIREVHPSELISLSPKIPTVFDPVIRYKIDTASPHYSEALVPPHFTNIQHGLSLARRALQRDTPNKQIILITDGLPTAHMEGQHLYLLYPPDSRTEEATIREARICAKEGVVVNVFILNNMGAQSKEDIAFGYKLAETTKGRAFFVAGKDIDRYVLWDFLERKRSILA